MRNCTWNLKEKRDVHQECVGFSVSVLSGDGLVVTCVGSSSALPPSAFEGDSWEPWPPF